MGEVWKDIEGYDGYYKVSNEGNVKSLDRIVLGNRGSKCRRVGRPMKLRVEKNGYVRVALSSDGKNIKFSVHRLVGIAFLDNKKGLPEINHIDGNKENNNVENLEWCSSRDNQLHAFASGLQRKRLGSELHQTKITEDNVRDIRNMWGSGKHKQYEIAKKYNLHPQYVSLVIHRKRWGYVL